MEQIIVIGQCSIYGYELDDKLEDIIAYINDNFTVIQLGKSTTSKILDNINLSTPDFLVKATAKALEYAEMSRAVVINNQPIYIDHIKYKIGNIYNKNISVESTYRPGSVYMKWSIDKGFWDIYVSEDQSNGNQLIEINEYLKRFNSTMQGITIPKIVDGWKNVLEVQKALYIALHQSNFFFVFNPYNKKEDFKELMIPAE